MSNEFLAEKFRPEVKEILGNLGDLYVFIDGRFVKGSEAKISVWDHALLYGDGVFEGVRAYNGKPFKLKEHVDRLFDSAKAIKLDNIPLTKEEISQAVVELLKKNDLKDGHIRIIVTRGVGRPGLDIDRCVRPSIIITAYPFPPLLGEQPVKLITSSVRRKSPFAVDSKIKSLNYLDNILAKIQASNVGADDAVMLDVYGFVAEATGENIFIVKEGRIYTPTTIAALHGITRATVIELARSLGYPVEERNITPYEIHTADEIFLVGTAAEIAPVGEVDGRRIGVEAPGPITKKLKEEFKKLTSGAS